MDRTIVASKAKTNEISLLTAILCLLVVFIHISSQAIVSLDKTSVQWFFIYIPWQASLFVVQGFIFLSAVKICRKYKQTQLDYKMYIAFVKNRISVIYIPYALWVMIYYLYFCSKGYFPFSIIEYFKYLLIGNLSSPFYFIVVIMQFYLLMPIWLYIVKRFKPIATIVVALVVTVLMMSYFPNILSKVSAGKIIFEYNDRVFTTYLIYWIGGCYVAVYLEEFKAWITRHIKWIVLSTLLLLALFAAMNYIQLLGIKNFKSIEIIHMFYCLGAITSLYSACMHLKTKNNKVTAALYNINKCSFYIYLSHCLVLNIIQEVCVSKEISSIASQFMIKALVVYGVTIIGSNLYLWIKQRLYNSIYKASENKEQV